MHRAYDADGGKREEQPQPLLALELYQQHYRENQHYYEPYYSCHGAALVLRPKRESVEQGLKRYKKRQPVVIKKLLCRRYVCLHVLLFFLQKV